MKANWIWTTVSVVLLLVIAPDRAWGQLLWCEVTESAKLLPDDGAADDLFGYSVAVSGEAAIIGVPHDDDMGDESGSAYVFGYGCDEPSWVWEGREEDKLTAFDGGTEDYFGWSVAICENTALIGAIYDDDAGEASGSAYVFRFDGTAWVHAQKLTASDAAEDDIFGYSVAIDQEVAVIGAPLGDARTGSAYVFRYNGTDWVEEQKLTASDGNEGDQFGHSVSVCDDVIVVSAVVDDDGGTDSGSAYVFQFNPNTGAWDQVAKLTASDGAALDLFGYSVSISNDVIVVGAYWDDDACPEDPQCNSGSAYIFEKPPEGWADMTETAKLTASDAAGGDYWGDTFGTCVSIHGDIVLVGAPGNDDGGFASGSAYVFMKPATGWADNTDDAKLTATDAAEMRGFGGAVCISGTMGVVGASGPGDSGALPGSAYFFRGLSDCNANGELDICEMDPDTTDQNENGILDECERGDMNCDGSVDFFDIDPFVLALMWPPEYDEQYPCGHTALADCNNDGGSDFFDIDPFVALITGGG